MTLVKVNNHQKPFGNLFDQFFNELPGFATRDFSNENFGFPPANIHETPNAYHLELNVPGRSKEDFKVNVENDLLTVSFEKKEETKADDYKTVRREFSFRSFKRSFNLDQHIDPTAIQAKYENGLLKLLLPKKEQVKESTRQINID